MRTVFKNREFLTDLREDLLSSAQDKYNHKDICASDIWRELQCFSEEYFRTNLKRHISKFYVGRDSRTAFADFSFDDNDNRRFIVNVKTYETARNVAGGSRCASIKKLLKGDAADNFDGLENPKHFYMIIDFKYKMVKVVNGVAHISIYECHVFPLCAYNVRLKRGNVKAHRVSCAGDIAVGRSSNGQLIYMPHRVNEPDAFNFAMSRTEWLDMIKERIGQDIDSNIKTLMDERESLCG